MKCQLLPLDAWERFQHLLQALTATLVKVGEVSYVPSLFSCAE